MRRKLKYNLKELIFLMVLDRVFFSESKLKVYLKQGRYSFLTTKELIHLYWSLDILAEVKEELEIYLFEKNRSLFNLEVDVVFYDTTSFYFESEKRDEVRDFGYSKDKKAGVQVVLGLLVDEEGRPIGFDVFRGNTFDGKTLRRVIDKLKERFSIRRIIIVGDKGMVSKENIEIIKRAGYEYIVGSKIKNKPTFL